MTAPNMESTVAALLAPGKGILAADESFPTIGKRFAALAIPDTEEHRRAYRELLFTTPGLGQCISGAILYDETIRQKTGAGMAMPETLIRQGIIPGIKVDLSTVPLANFPDEKVTQGLDGLRERLAGYRKLGARFTKWRAVIAIGERLPTAACIEANAGLLARFAALSQEAGLVPIVEPEVLMDGNHTFARCEEIMALTLQTVFAALFAHRVGLKTMLLKTGMVLPGKACSHQVDAVAVAEATIRCLRRVVPAAVPGIVFLSGGQSDVDATERLNAICRVGGATWTLSFSFGRALQDAAIRIWQGSPVNVAAAQAALQHRAKCNGLAVQGKYSVLEEREATGGATKRCRDQATLPTSAGTTKNVKTARTSGSRRAVHAVAKTSRPQSPLVSSRAEAKREGAGLRRGLKRLASSPTAAETDIRSSLI